MPVSFPGIGITKTPYYKMNEELKKAKINESHIKYLNDLKYGIFPPKKKARHYSLENIKKELYEVYKYKNELEEQKNVDAISKKLKSIIKSSNQFWEKSLFLPKISNPSQSQAFSNNIKENLTGNTTKSVESSRAKSFIFTKGSTKVRLEEHYT